MILTHKRLLVDIFSLTDYKNHSHFASLGVLIYLVSYKPTPDNAGLEINFQSCIIL